MARRTASWSLTQAKIAALLPERRRVQLDIFSTSLSAPHQCSTTTIRDQEDLPARTQVRWWISTAKE